MQLFSAVAKIFLKKLKKKFFAPQNIEKWPSKVAHNPTRPRVFSPASIWLCGTETVFTLFFFSSLKLSNFAGRVQSLRLAPKRYLIANHSTLFSLSAGLKFSTPSNFQRYQYLQIQQTPKPLAQGPSPVPSNLVHSSFR